MRTARPTPPDGSPPSGGGQARLRARIAELERERDHLVAAVALLESFAAAGHFAEIAQSVARVLGESFGLDRCSVFLRGNAADVRLVASFEDPSIRNLVVDLPRYPELEQALASGQTVFIPDAAREPMLRAARPALDIRNVRAILVVPIRARGLAIGAIFLRTDRDGAPFDEGDVRFCQVVAELTASALRRTHEHESLRRAATERTTAERRDDLRRGALVAFVRRLLTAYGQSDSQALAEAALGRTADEELERLVGLSMKVIEAEAAG